jgi:hypothetical protein
MWVWFLFWTGGVYFLASLPGILLAKPEVVVLSREEITVTTATATRHWHWSEISFLELSKSRKGDYSVRLTSRGKQESLFMPSDPDCTRIVFNEIRAFLTANDLKDVVTLCLADR